VEIAMSMFFKLFDYKQPADDDIWGGQEAGGRRPAPIPAPPTSPHSCGPPPPAWRGAGDNMLDTADTMLEVVGSG
jgi:hypothetical protein